MQWLENPKKQTISLDEKIRFWFGNRNEESEGYSLSNLHTRPAVAEGICQPSVFVAFVKISGLKVTQISLEAHD